jgi:hypothetical protein
MKRTEMNYRWLKVLMVAVAGLTAGCDAVVEPGNHPAGAVFLRADGAEAARFVYQGSITGGLAVPVSGTATYRVRVITETGDLADFDGDEYSIDDVRVLIPALVGVSLQGQDQLVLSGLVAGGTTLRFQLEHGGHSEFEIRDIPVTVQ